MEKLSELLQKYKRNMDYQRKLDENLLIEQRKEDWIAFLQKRGEENQRMYRENGELILQLENILKEDLTVETAEILFEQARDMYVNNYDDCEILLPMFHKLEAYYEKKEENVECLEKLLYIYSALYYETSEVQKRREGAEELDAKYNVKIFAYKERYLELPLLARRSIWVAIYNTIVTGASVENVGVDNSYRYYKRAMEFWNRPEIQALDGRNETIVSIVERIRKEWLTIQYYIEDAQPETKTGFYELAEEIYRQEIKKAGSVYGVGCDIYSAYLHARVLMGKATIQQAIGSFLSYYHEKVNRLPDTKEITTDDFLLITNAPLTLERWGRQVGSKEEQKEIMQILKKMTQESWYKKLGKYNSPFLNALMARWCFDVIKYMETQEEKEELLFQLLIERQLPTYLHSVMVTYLAEVLTKTARRERPELFESLGMDKKELRNFVEQCALLHDIGKTKITDIVTTQGRQLTENEFAGIRKHPEYGANMLEKDEHLKKYRDIALGHHKFYDGTAGYPEDFDNVNSPYRIIIDIITICDCIDAATDNFGRNYKKAKSLQQVIQELQEGKGTRYNPDLVDIIVQSSNLQMEMNYIVSEARLNTMYRAYVEHSR